MSITRKKLFALAAAGALFLQNEDTEKVKETIMTAFDENIDKINEELEKEVKRSIADDKIANDKYNKEQMKLRKKFQK